MERPSARGRFLHAGGEKLWVRGVTYGTFRPDAQGDPLPPRDVVGADFAEMARRGMNAVRVYTTPPRWLLDLAGEAGLRVMAGLSWPHHDAFLDIPGRVHEVEQRVRADVRSLAGHPALLCWAIGNEIPAGIVRWLGERRVERFLHRLCDIVREEDHGALVTYVNFPSTEYLQLPFLDVVCFNVYLESRDRLEGYLARLQNLADDRPLLMAEIGLDSRRNGEDRQAVSLRGQIETAFAAGCSGTFVYAWTDEWYRGGHDITDWDFGLTRRDRAPKPALAVVSETYARMPFAGDASEWPRISVVVCSYNGSRTIRDTLEGLARVDYPDFEVIVVDDGSTDAVSAIASEYDVRLIRTENRGLSSARNTGCNAATGDIVAYVDDDAWPDPDWLRYLALQYRRGDLVGVGGPNLPPPGDGPIADCVANAPGGPVHVLLDDRLAEHIPGCNMSFRRDALLAVGGFDPVYRVAGDDVDLCWRLQARGGRIGFAPAAVVWHHRRNSVRTYWRQQKGYGKAEALLERKWPERYNANGHLSWQGRLYGRGWTLALDAPGGRIYRGSWNTAPFQSLYQRTPSPWLALPLMPEWLLLVAVLAGLSALGLGWRPLLVVALPLLLVAAALPLAQAILSARHARFTSGRSGPGRAWRYLLTAFLHLVQPLARLIGRIQHGLVPWRRRGPERRLWRVRTLHASWREAWKAPEARLAAMESALRGAGAVCRRAGEWDDWDLETRGGFLGGARLRMAVEEHGSGRQLVRIRTWMLMQKTAIVAAAGLVGLGVSALFAGAIPVGAILLTVAAGWMFAAAAQSARAMAAFALARPAAESEAAVTVAPAKEPAAGWAEAALPLTRAAGEER
jgi:GT2 family glycosyltransferase